MRLNLQKVSLGLFLLLGSLFSHNAQAGIHGTLEVHNSRSSSITVTVTTSDGYSNDYTVSAQSYLDIDVNDTTEGTTWLYAYQGYNELKREAVNGSYSSYTWWVD